jgi:hypothetical protein
VTYINSEKSIQTNIKWARYTKMGDRKINDSKNKFDQVRIITNPLSSNKVSMNELWYWSYSIYGPSVFFVWPFTA